MRTFRVPLFIPVVATLLLATNAAHAVTFDYTIPLPVVPAANPPVTKVVIILDVSGDPTGQTITIDNFNGGSGGSSTPTTITVTAAPALPTLLSANDTARAYRKGAANQVVIEVNALSWLQDSLNMCNMKAGQTPKKFAFAASGLSSTGFRIASYAAAADLSSPVPTKQIQCNCSGARVKSYAAIFGTAPAGTNKGRLPYDVILVLDHSGSMSSPAFGDVTVKWSLLKQAVGEYIDAWKAEVTSPTADQSDDHLGVVFFSTTSQTSPLGLVSRGPFGASPHPWDQIMTAVNGQSPTGSTALGSGLKESINTLLASAQGDRVVLLLTDGLQNQIPMVTPPSGATSVKLLDLGSGSVELYKQCVRVYTIGMGSSLEMVAGELLEAIANQCSAVSEIVSGGTISGSFGDILVDMLTGNTLSVATRTEGTLALGGATSDKISVTVDGSAKYLIATIDWPPQEQFTDVLDLRLFKEGSETPIAPQQRTTSSFYVVERFAVPAPGNYYFRANTVPPIIIGARPGSAAAAAAAPATVAFHASAYAIEADLDFRATFNAAHHGTGDPLKIDIQVSLDGVGVKNIANGIKVHVQRPGDGVGNQLHNSGVTGGGSGSGSGTPDPLSPYEQKLAALANDPNFQKAVAPQTDPNALAVTDKGGGNYSAELADTGTKIPGKYHFDMVLEFTNPKNGQTIHRLKTLEAAVEVIPAPEQSVVTVTGNAPAIDISIVPRDRFGNYKGPGYGNIVNVTVSGGGNVVGAPADSQQQGVYVVHLDNVPAGSDPTVTIDIGGTVLGKKPISVWKNGERGCFHCFGSSSSATTPSKVGTLGSFVLIGLVAYRRRRR